jgi:tetratricopeptide (TPR) repeat protein
MAYKGNALLGLGRFDEAVQAYDCALEILSDDIVAWFNRGTALLQQGKLEDALKSYDEVLARDPNHGNAYLNKSCILYELGRIAEAVECCRKGEQFGITGTQTRFARNARQNEIG